MALLPHDRLRALHEAAISAGLGREALLGGVNTFFARSIPAASNPLEQVLVDLRHMNEVDALTDGSVPLLTWLHNAVTLTKAQPEGLVLEAAHREVISKEPGPKPIYPDEHIKRLFADLERERGRKRVLEQNGQSSEAVSLRILEIRRKLREGGRLEAGDTLKNRWALLDVIGKGGFATVYKARDRERGTIVAIKVLHANLAKDEVRRDRFFRGARIMTDLDHPGIVKVLSAKEEDEGYHFFVMEHVEGGDLHHAVVDGHVPKERVLPLILEVGEALAVAHQRGYVHRDVKPANILLGLDGKPKLTDFDLVGVGDTTGGTRTGALGTFLYAAPECLDKPQDADGRADVFGLAMTMVFGLYGKVLPKKVLRDTSTFIKGLSCEWSVKEVLERALEWEREERLASVEALCKALKSAVAKPMVAPRLLPKVQPAERAIPVEPKLWKRQGQDKFGSWATFEVMGVEQRMRRVPPGTFLIGSPEDEEHRYSDEGPQHEVTLTQGFWLAETPCTQALWQAVMGDIPSRFKGPTKPVENVSWEDCQRFLAKLEGLLPGLGVRLPTEAEWERACRAGTTEARYALGLEAIAWFYNNAGGETHSVREKLPNGFGLYDMLGNVWEWCADGQRQYSKQPVTDPRGPDSMGSIRVLRGGSWNNVARFVRAAYRYAAHPGRRVGDLGLRLARGQTSPVEQAPDMGGARRA